MISKSTILSAAERLDSWLPSGLSNRVAAACQRLVILLVHSLYTHETEPEEFGVFPHERMTVAKLRHFLESFLERGYSFLSPDDLQSSKPLPEKAIMLTFDDGYFNFVRALPILHEFAVPATLFVCPGYVAESESFWWDAFFRHARSGGESERRTRREMSRLRKKSFDELYRFLTSRWGKHSVRPSNDLDRPLTLDELKDVARDPLVQIGNHTLRHTALPFQNESVIRSEIAAAEDFLDTEMGIKPRLISYPNGDYGADVVKICERLGYQFGMTINARSNTVDELTKDSRFTIGRFMLSGERDVERQVHSIDRSFSVASLIRRMKRHRYG